MSRLLYSLTLLLGILVLAQARPCDAEWTKDITCPARHAELQAAEEGGPFKPLRGLSGCDVRAYRPEWKVIDNPFGNDDPIVLLPAIRPDVALFHAPFADRDGNVALRTACTGDRDCGSDSDYYPGNGCRRYGSVRIQLCKPGQARPEPVRPRNVARSCQCSKPERACLAATIWWRLRQLREPARSSVSAGRSCRWHRAIAHQAAQALM